MHFVCKISKQFCTITHCSFQRILFNKNISIEQYLFSEQEAVRFQRIVDCIHYRVITIQQYFPTVIRFDSRELRPWVAIFWSRVTPSAFELASKLTFGPCITPWPLRTWLQDAVGQGTQCALPSIGNFAMPFMKGCTMQINLPCLVHVK